MTFPKLETGDLGEPDPLIEFLSETVSLRNSLKRNDLELIKHV